MKYGFAQMRIVTFCNKEDNEKYHNKQKAISYEISPQIYTRTCLIDNKKKIAYVKKRQIKIPFIILLVLKMFLRVFVLLNGLLLNIKKTHIRLVEQICA